MLLKKLIIGQPKEVTLACLQGLISAKTISKIYFIIVILLSDLRIYMAK